MDVELTQSEQKYLHQVAQLSLKDGVQQSHQLNKTDFPEATETLRKNTACFVTLHDEEGELRGCIGSMLPHRPLVEDVYHQAYQAGFKDPRFLPLTKDELPNIHVSISVLGEPYPVDVDSEEDLRKKLRPGQDGLIITSGWRRALFLPEVWEQLPDPEDFVHHLKIKAGFEKNEWPEDIQVSFFSSFCF